MPRGEHHSQFGQLVKHLARGRPRTANAETRMASARRRRMARISERAILGAAINGALFFAERRLARAQTGRDN